MRNLAKYVFIKSDDCSPKVDYLDINQQPGIFRVKLLKFEDGIDVNNMTNPKI